MAMRIFLILTFSVVVVFLMVGILLLSSSSSYHNIRDAIAQQVINTNPKLSLSSLIQQGSPLLGKSSSAPITIVEFADFQCHFCDRFAKQTEPQINQTYIQTGKVNMVFKHFPIRGVDSKPAAIAAQCTNEQGKFWDFYKLLYDNQKYKSLVDSDIAFATSLGVRDVPYFIVVKHDGSSPETLIGAQPFSSFKAVIDKK